jgi:glycerol-3-phosphate dehydrogenase (NAD(P)+)
MNHRKVAVLVAGSWGTALASVLASNEHEVRLWTHDPKQAATINETHMNVKLLPGVLLPANIVATTNMAEAVDGVEMVVIVAPSKAMREVAHQLAPLLGEKTVVVHATKGFEAETLKSMSQVIVDEIPHLENQIVVLSGPSHAEEVIQKSPTTVVVASKNLKAASLAQDLFMSPNFRVYTNTDIVGVEIAGALKNIIALGAGLSDGLGFGDNAKAALMTRGLAEISRLGTAMGADMLTFSGLAGVGDLIVTCTSKHSRNWRAGYALGQGQSLQEVLDNMGMVVEGVRTTQAANLLAQRYDVDMPITKQLYEFLFEGKTGQALVENLMGRDRTHENR